MKEKADKGDGKYMRDEGSGDKKVPETKNDEVPKTKNDKEFVQWHPSGNIYLPTGKTIPRVPAGMYSVVWEQGARRYVLRLEKLYLDDLFVLPDKILDKVLYDIRNFWKLEKAYKKYNYVYKRGILLYGQAGCGKSCIAMLLAQELINEGGIVININHPSNLGDTKEALLDFKQIEPNRKIIVIIEDIDNFMDEGEGYLTELLNLLDGGLQMPNIVILATTNFPEKLQRRISHRPSRFDRRYEVGLPSAKTRKYYIKHKVPREDLEKINLDDLVAKTNDFTLDHLKELILSIFVLGYDPEEAYNEIEEMLKKGKLLNEADNSKVGFS